MEEAAGGTIGDGMMKAKDDIDMRRAEKPSRWLYDDSLPGRLGLDVGPELAVSPALNVGQLGFVLFLGGCSIQDSSEVDLFVQIDLLNVRVGGSASVLAQEANAEHRLSSDDSSQGGVETVLGKRWHRITTCYNHGTVDSEVVTGGGEEFTDSVSR